MSGVSKGSKGGHGTKGQGMSFASGAKLETRGIFWDRNSRGSPISEDDDLYPETDSEPKDAKRENFEEPESTMHRTEICNNCCFWNKDYWYRRPPLRHGREGELIEGEHTYNRFPQYVRTSSTYWCGEHKGE